MQLSELNNQKDQLILKKLKLDKKLKDKLNLVNTLFNNMIFIFDLMKEKVINSNLMLLQ